MQSDLKQRKEGDGRSDLLASHTGNCSQLRTTVWVVFFFCFFATHRFDPIEWETSLLCLETVIHTGVSDGPAGSLDCVNTVAGAVRMESTLFHSLAMITAGTSRRCWNQKRIQMESSDAFFKRWADISFVVPFDLIREEMRIVPVFCVLKDPSFSRNGTNKLFLFLFFFCSRRKVSHLNRFLTELLFNSQTDWKVPNLKCWNLCTKKWHWQHVCVYQWVSPFRSCLFSAKTCVLFQLLGERANEVPEGHMFFSPVNVWANTRSVRTLWILWLSSCEHFTHV